MFKFDEALKSKHKRDLKFSKTISGIQNSLKSFTTEKENRSSLTKLAEKQLSLECDELFRLFKTQIINVARNDEKLYESLKTNKFIWKLFPYVEFENNPEANVLLVTIKKVMMGFFDGKKDIKIASIEDKIIFLDEFDFLEQEVIQILCNAPAVNNPLEFVRIFYEKFNHWSKSEFWDSSEHLQGVKAKFIQVIKYIDDKMKEKKLNFPSVIDFKLDKQIASKPKPYLLFKTNEIITPRPFFLMEKNNSWYIQDKKTADCVSPFELFDILTIATNKILAVFHYYYKDQNLLSELIQAIWNQKNDNTGGRYEDYIQQNCLYHRTKAKSGKDHELYKDKSPYEIGFRLVKLEKRTNNFDPDSAELDQIELFTSPEAVVAKLSDTNLVFALSATADIPRTLKCFNLEWLKENANYIPLEETDYQIIEARRNDKRDKRKTQVRLTKAGTLPDSHFLTGICKNLHQNGFFSKGNNESESAELPRLNRVLKVFDTLYQLAKGDKYAHLIFLTTFGDFKEIIDYNCNKHKQWFVNCDGRTFGCTRKTKQNDKFFNLLLDGKECSLLFLNSDDATELERNKEWLETYRKCFELKDKVFVITQYQSASNGINLPCYPSMGTIEKDFDGIALLEPRHFWLDDSDVPDEWKNINKQALWYSWKLKDAGQIENSQFRIALSSRDPKNPYKLNIRHVNNVYKQRADEKILNSIALYHQAIGRIERRNDQINQVDVVLDDDVLNDFYTLLASESFQEIISTREKITSDLIIKVHQAVLDFAKGEKIKIGLDAQKSIWERNNNANETIRELLSEIEKVKSGIYDEPTSSEIKSAWGTVREAILQHDFDKRINLELLGKTIQFRRDFCFETKFINAEKELYIEPEKMKVYRAKPLGGNAPKWSLDAAYRVISENQQILNHFNSSGYKTAFDIKPHSINNIPCPYIYHAILLGAIGEEAITCLLAANGISIDGINELPNSLFEIVDSKMKNQPVYFDFKNYSEGTLNKFVLTSDDYNYDPELNSAEFIRKVKAKYEILKQVDPNAILYVLNLYSSNERSPAYFDADMKPVKYEKDSRVRIISSVLRHDNKSVVSPEFEAALKFMTVYEAATV